MSHSLSGQKQVRNVCKQCWIRFLYKVVALTILTRSIHYLPPARCHRLSQSVPHSTNVQAPHLPHQTYLLLVAPPLNTIYSPFPLYLCERNWIFFQLSFVLVSLP